ncbi:MAG: N-acetyltransferase [Rhodospirillales bacterium]|nr:N-acetyltransferase [Rhodospirillales bacterium]
MNAPVDIRTSLAVDAASLENLYREAFPEEDLLELVDRLLREKDGVLSLVALDQGVIVGHAIFTLCGITGGSQKVALLGPVAVSPVLQKRGIGSALIQDGLARLSDDDVRFVYVLGDPVYYGRFGFQAQNTVMPPYTIPEEWTGAWQSLCLGDVAELRPGCMLAVPGVWRDPALWRP